MEPQKDFKELLELLNAHQVKYLIVGGYALAFHGAPRFTGDLDIYVLPSRENAERVMDALNDFGFGSVGLQAADFEIPDQVVQLGVPPVRVDILTSISGVDLKEAWDARVVGTYGNIEVFFISRKHFISNKRAIGRTKDLADIEALIKE